MDAKHRKERIVASPPSEQSGQVSEASSRHGNPVVQLVPRRFWWLKRLCILAGCLLVGLVCLRWWWGFEADRRLQAEVERYRLGGQPVYASEIDGELEAVPDEQNAAILLEKAISAITATTQSGVRYADFMDEASLFEDNMTAAAELMESNRGVLDLVRQARARPQVAWSQRLQNLFMNFNLSLGSGQRSLARLLWFSAHCHYRTGNHAEAVETLRDFLAFNEGVEAHPTLILSLVAWACHNLAFSLVEECGAGLNVVDAGSETNAGSKPARRQQIEELIRSLLDEDTPREALVRTFYGERACMFDWFDSVSRGMIPGRPFPAPSLWSRATDFLERPLLELDLARVARYDTMLAGAAAESNYPAAAERIPVKTPSPSLIREISRSFSEIGLDSTARSIQIYFKYLARRRMTATALAIRLYVVENGRRPEDLTQLVPDYLPAVPLDPFSADGTTIRYKPSAERPILYSVGLGGTDNEGMKTRRPDGRIDFDKSNILFYLDGRIVENGKGNSEASSEAGENDENGEHKERKPNEDQSGQGDP